MLIGNGAVVPHIINGVGIIEGVGIVEGVSIIGVYIEGVGNDTGEILKRLGELVD